MLPATPSLAVSTSYTLPLHASLLITSQRGCLCRVEATKSGPKQPQRSSEWGQQQGQQQQLPGPSGEPQDSWGIFDAERYKRRWDVPWGAGAVAGALVLAASAAIAACLLRIGSALLTKPDFPIT